MNNEGKTEWEYIHTTQNGYTKYKMNTKRNPQF